MPRSIDIVPPEWVEEALFDHLVLGHNVNPDQLIHMRDHIVEGEWRAFLIKSHALLHILESDEANVDEH